MPMSPPLDGLPKPRFSDPRKTSLEVHAHLRRLIIDSILPPNTVLKQTEVATAFAVSRTPVREAFRMLQEEGLIEADLNQRGRVRGLDPDELDQLYAARITLESLGTRISTGLLGLGDAARARSWLNTMASAETDADMETWVTAHRNFHASCMARAGEPLARTINSFSERSERYLRLYQLWHPQSFTEARGQHENILSAVLGDDAMRAGALMAQHLARTALTVLRDVAAGAEPHAINQALAMATAAG